MNRILITGSEGQLGSSLVNILNKKYKLLKPQRKELDFINNLNIKEYLQNASPDIIINCAAYTNVEKAQLEKKICRKINTDAIYPISVYCENNNKTLIQISTDYVFGNNTQKIPWKETDKTKPLNYYGKTKYKAEEYLLSKKFDYLIIRTSGVYSNHKQNNFLHTMLKLFLSKKSIDVVGDQVCCPTPSWWLAEVILKIIAKKLAGSFNKDIKLLHATCRGEVSWYNFTKHILYYLNSFDNKNHHVEINKISFKNYPSKVIRPNYSVLDNSLLNSIGIDSISWSKALKKTLQYMKSINE